MPRRPKALIDAIGLPPGLIALLTITVLLVGGWALYSDDSNQQTVTAEPGCQRVATDLELTTPSDIGTIPLADVQIENADIIVRTAMATGRTRTAATIALATAMQESALLNIAHGDEAGPDSRGLFQQRLQFYGDVDVMDPASATTAFLDRLDAVSGWQDLAPHEAIQSVQRAAYPELYAGWIDPAAIWTDALWTRAETCAARATTASVPSS